MRRKLASIQRIWKIEPIEGADRIELAHVLGWQCVVNKGQFKPMDLPSKYPTVEALLERADGEYPNGGRKEGIVIRPTEPIFSERISSALSMKVVSNKYLLKNEGK